MIFIIINNMDSKPAETSYENYSSASLNYDTGRAPLGLKQMVDAIKKYGPEETKAVADIGCGTGNYLVAMKDIYESGVGVDINGGMLEAFDKKIEAQGLKGKLKTVLASGSELPFEENSFDAVIACLTIHHHGSDENKLKFLSEVRRILKPGGVFVLNHNADVHFSSFWYLSENPRVRALMEAKGGSIPGLLEMAEKAGLGLKEQIPIPDLIVPDPKVFTTKEGRTTTSVFALFSEEEDKEFESKLKQRLAEGSWEKWAQEQCGENIAKWGVTAHFVFTK